MKTVDDPARFLCESGLLGEINRALLHPFGVAMALDPDEKGPSATLKLLDARDDPEGFTFEDWMLEEFRERLGRFLIENHDRLRARVTAVGFLQQGGTESLGTQLHNRVQR